MRPKERELDRKQEESQEVSKEDSFFSSVLFFLTLLTFPRDMMMTMMMIGQEIEKRSRLSFYFRAETNRLLFNCLVVILFSSLSRVSSSSSLERKTGQD